MNPWLPNGVDFATGRALPTPSDPAAVLQKALASAGVAGFQKFALPFGLESAAIDKVGWGVVFAPGVPAEVRKGLGPLLAHRRTQAGTRFKELEWVPGDSARKFLQRHLASLTVDPRRLPYYLLLVGSPAEVPFAVQSELAASYAVGRLDLGPDPAPWLRYAEGVRAAETGAPLRPRRVGFWATRHDESTRLSHDQFARHLAEGETGAGADAPPTAAAVQGFDTVTRMGSKARKAGLLELLADAPGVLVTASHGLGVPGDAATARQLQGGLLTQEFAGMGAPTPEQLVTAADLGADVHVHGAVALLMACFGGGTPATDDFPWPGTDPGAAPWFHGQPFTAALPNRLLSHDNGPALSVLAHVDRAWAWSFAPAIPADRNGVFRTFLARVMGGEPVGHAARAIGERHGELAVRLASLVAPGVAPPSEAEFLETWLELRDMRNYLVLGDPAARASV